MKNHRNRNPNSILLGLIGGAVLVLAVAAPGADAQTVKAKQVKVEKKLAVGGSSAGVAKFKNGQGSTTVKIQAGKGNVIQNLVAPGNPGSGNGLISAWARVDDNGAVTACWRCDLTKTTEIVDGDYRVCFAPLAADIRGRPVIATIQEDLGNTDPDNSAGAIAVAEDATNFDCIRVETFRPDPDKIVLDGEDFTIALF